MTPVVVGSTDLATTHPEIARELVDSSLATRVTSGSSKPVDWVCDVSWHHYRQRVDRRVAGRKCHYCYSPVRLLVGFNDLSVTHPELAAELVDPSLAYAVTAGAAMPLEWMCQLGHTWRESPAKRAGGNYGCPYCSGHRVWLGFNDLETTHPDLAEEALFDPTTVSAGCKKQADWHGSECQHVWSARIIDRAISGSGCIYCTNQAVLAGFNDLATTHPDLSKEALFDPTTVMAGTKRRGDWRCSDCGFEWNTAIKNRACFRRGCWECAESGYKNSRPGGCYLVSTDPADGLLTVEFGKANEESMEERLRLHAGSGLGTVHQIVVFEDGAAGTEFENLIIATMAEFGVPSCSDDGVKFDGSTEAFFLTEGSLDFARWLFAEFGTRLPYGWASSVLAAH